MIGFSPLPSGCYHLPRKDIFSPLSCVAGSETSQPKESRHTHHQAINRAPNHIVKKIYVGKVTQESRVKRQQEANTMAMEKIPRLKLCASISSEVCGGGNVGRSSGGKYYGKGKNNGVPVLESWNWKLGSLDQ